MSGRLKRIHSIDELTALTAPVEETLSVNELPRFVEALAVDQLDDASVSCRLEFDATGAHKVRVHGRIDASVLTQCQRCLDGLELDMMIPVDWQLPDDMQGADEDNVGSTEIRLLDWVEDELQLGIPLFAKHDDEHCGGELAKSYVASDEQDTPDTVTPFDGLKDLLSKQ